MRRHQAVILVIGMLLAANGPADAAMLTLPEDPKSGHRLEMGLDYENTLRRELDDIGTSDNDVKRYDAAYLRIQYAAHALLNAYARVGSGKVTHRLEDLPITGIGQRDLTFESDRALAWGGGVTGGLALPGEFKIGYDAAYHTLTADVREVTHANGDAPDPLANFSRTGTSVSGELGWREYQATAWIARPLELEQIKWIPYFGVKWSRLTLDDDDVRYTVTDAGAPQTLTVNTSSDNNSPWGLVLGFRFVFDRRLVIVIEGHELDDESVIASASWRF